MIDASSPWQLAIATAATTVAAAGAVGFVRREALGRQILDVPNARSSHTMPIPRGGGAGVIAVFIAGIVLLATAGALRWTWPVTGIAIGAAMVAFVGWVDDRRGLPVLTRFAVHLIAGALAALVGARLGWSWPMALIGGLAVVVSINVVNFMDGIDGLVASQAAIAFALLVVLAPPSGTVRPLAVLAMGACLGFLVWNWPPARIFLGDVGSGVLGFLLCVLGILTVTEAHTGVVRTFLPLLPLVLDAAFTLVTRALHGERVTQAHRRHLYQRLANGGWGHRRVTVLFGVCALLGALVALVPVPQVRPVLEAAYAAGLLLLGWRLSRTRPIDWSTR